MKNYEGAVRQKPPTAHTATRSRCSLCPERRHLIKYTEHSGEIPAHFLSVAKLAQD